MTKTKKVKDKKSKKKYTPRTPRAPRGNPPTTTDYSVLPRAPITAPVEYHNSYNNYITNFDRQLGGRRKIKKRKSLKKRNKSRRGGRKLRNINPASIPE
jgi:hypothetical protein